jgi:L-fuculose-phosphate aldolase
MTLEAPVILDMEGNKLEGEGKPSSEGRMHVEVYRLRNDVNAVIHAHPPKCIAFTVAGVPLDTCLLPEVVVTIGSVPTSPYATPTTAEVPRSIHDLIIKSDAVMLSRHGSLTIGKDLPTAFKILEKMEHTATIALYARQLGGPKPFSPEELSKLYDLREKWNVTGPIRKCNTGDTCSLTGEVIARTDKSETQDNTKQKSKASEITIDIEEIVDSIVDRIKEEEQ